MNLIEYANDSTRRIVEARGRDAVLLIKPSGYHQLGKILSTIEESDMSIVRMKMIRIESRDLKQLAEQIDDDSFQQNKCVNSFVLSMIHLISSCSLIALEILPKISLRMCRWRWKLLI